MAAQKYSFQVEEDAVAQSVGERERQSRLSTLARNFLVIVNSITLVTGLAVLALGTYAYVQYSNNFAELVSELLVTSVIIIGVIIAFISGVGLYGAIVHSRKSLIVYVVVLLCIIAAQTVGVLMAVDYMRVVNKVASADYVPGSLEDSTEISINNYLLSAYDTCCVSDDEFCSVLSSRPNFCEPVQRCEDIANSTIAVCYTDVAEDAELPPVGVERGVCTTLETIAKVDDKAVVGDAGNGYSCGGGNAAEFFRNFYDWFVENVNIARDIFIVITTIEVIAAVLSIVLMCIEPPEVADGQQIAHLEDGMVSYDSPLHSTRASNSRLSNRASTAPSSGLSNRGDMSASARASERLSNRATMDAMRFDNHI